MARLRGELADGAVLVPACELALALHRWGGGAYGDLVDASDGAPVPVHHKGSRDASAVPAQATHVQLALEEAYYLAYRTGVLEVRHGGALLNSDVVFWPHLARAASSARFAHELAAYVHLRAAGWLVRPGSHFGADFVLYEPAAAHAHAPLCALVTAPGVDPPLTWRTLQMHTRLSAQVAKGLVLCEVVEGEGGGCSIARYAVRAQRVGRWLPGKAHGELTESAGPPKADGGKRKRAACEPT